MCVSDGGARRELAEHVSARLLAVLGDELDRQLDDAADYVDLSDRRDVYAFVTDVAAAGGLPRYALWARALDRLKAPSASGGAGG